MKIIGPVVTTLLFVWSAVCASSLGVAVVGPLTQTAFKCLAQNQLTGSSNLFAIIRVYQVSGTPGIDPNAYQTLININTVTVAGGYNIHTYMEICRGTDPTSQVTAVVNQISIDLYETIFIKVEPNTTPGCSWEGYNKTDNCNFLTEAINAVNSLNIGRSGVFSTAHIWESYFGNDCNSISTVTKYLWYANYNSSGQVNSTSSFNDFVPFGGWKSPDLKQVGGSITV